MNHIPKIPQLKGFIIFRPEDGKYSKGGINGSLVQPDWGKKPKIWNTIGALKNHLNQFVGSGLWQVSQKDRIVAKTSVYKDCVVYDVTTGETAQFSIRDYLLEKAKEEQARYLKKRIDEI